MKLHHPHGPVPEGVDVLWRCEAKSYSYVIDADREEYGVTAPRLEMRWYHVDRRTPKGAYCCGEFVRLTAYKKRFAETEADALRDFKARKNKQIQILSRQLVRAERELALTKPNHDLLVA
ncbi:hypothetical protein [Bradyrhizobium elkanii]|jgi:hypothetical protein|uniref:Uncharacterized protein n=1 Tax=Bradyrhizobium elkanii TaxID=29448 RepID=A0ABV4F2F6_BRAEL|nr:hypothetical protein [Bradyrhizobium elkanii]MCP1932209.1 hypothetical protein [Bradyrhizobium elkanii]MCS3577251.1 hypothetical protein [Bradyrhizobium elkanii]MCS3720128.1 hypothetical protein [Bradyrhizobium elkanii]MCS3890519.1 hypothetical protein [Bradyrhizobium elkanii]MCS4004545.1 hypothetical protein [Bradyrhizobium elkanii USDA 61]